MSFYIGYILSVISLVLYGYKYFKNPVSKRLKWFVLFLSALVLIDFLVTIFIKLKSYSYNMFLYNLLTLLEFNFLFLFYFKNSSEEGTKKIIKGISVIFNIIFAATSIPIGWEIMDKIFNHYGAITGAVSISIILVLHLRELLLSETILNYKRNVFFWIATGLLLYYLGTLPITAVVNLWISRESFQSYRLIIIQHSLTMIMHCCFIIGVVWNFKKIK